MSKKKNKEVAVVQAVQPAADTDSWVDVLVPVGTLAKSIADTDFVPDHFRGRVGSVAAAILYGREVNLPPMSSLTSIHVVKGKPSLSAESMRGLVLAAGHEIQFVEANSSRCVVAGRRRGQERWTEASFSMDDARRAGLSGGNWNKYPQEMMVARATTRLCRMMFPDVISGLRTVEEAEDMPDSPSTPPAAPTKRKRVTRARKPAPPIASTTREEPAPPQADLPALPSPEKPPQAPDGTVSRDQITKMQAQFTDLEIKEREHKLQLLEAVLERKPITSSMELSKAEATTVIDHLATIQAAKDPAEALAFTYASADPQ